MQNWTSFSLWSILAVVLFQQAWVHAVDLELPALSSLPSVVTHVDIDGDGINTAGDQLAMAWWLQNGGSVESSSFLLAFNSQTGLYDLSSLFGGSDIDSTFTSPLPLQAPGPILLPTIAAANMDVVAPGAPPQQAAALPISECTFRRGDANGDLEVNIADAIYLLGALHSGGPEPVLLDAGDVNDSGSIDVADAIFLLNYLGGIGVEPPAPFGVPGLDYTRSLLTDPGCIETAILYRGYLLFDAVESLVGGNDPIVFTWGGDFDQDGFDNVLVRTQSGFVFIFLFDGYGFSHTKTLSDIAISILVVDQPASNSVKFVVVEPQGAKV